MKRDIATVLLAGCTFGVALFLAHQSGTSAAPVSDGSLVGVLALVMIVMFGALTRLYGWPRASASDATPRRILLGAAGVIGVAISFPLADLVAPQVPSLLTGTALDGSPITSFSLSESDGHYFKTINRPPPIEVSSAEYRELNRRFQVQFVGAAVQFSCIAFVFALAALLAPFLRRRRNGT